MKLRTSSSDTLLKKDITRFLPFWSLYTLCLLLGLMVLIGGEKDSFYQAMNLAACARNMAPINGLYALLVAELLFGDLFDSRMCNGLHSLPLRRETIFGIHILSGTLFSLVPTLVMALISLPIMMQAAVVNAWQISFLWLLATNLEFLFFYGLAVLCVFLTGNRFAMAVVYGILNLWSVLLQMVAEIIYLPLLPGVSVNTDWFQSLCPLVRISQNRLLYVERELESAVGTFRLEPGWGYLWLCAGIGLLLMGLALLLYRKRKLETAGDFIAVKSVKPVFLVIFALMAACGFSLCSGELFGYGRDLTFNIIFSVAGLLIGWFIGAMLMEKTMRVFTKRILLGGGILTAAVLLSILLTWLDPLGIHKWLPDEQEVAYVRIIDSYDYYGSGYTRRTSSNAALDENAVPPDAITDLGDIHSAVRLHTLAMEQKITQKMVNSYYETYSSAVQPGEEPPEPERSPVAVSFEYTMKDGTVVRRYYYIWNDGESGQLASWLFSRPQVVFGDLQNLEILGMLNRMVLYNTEVPEEYLEEDHMEALKQAILQDCEEGHMAQIWDLHHKNVFQHPDYPMEGVYLSMESLNNGIYLTVFGDSTHTLRWMEDRGILDLAKADWLEQVEGIS